MHDLVNGLKGSEVCTKKARREGPFLVCDCGYKEFA